MKAPHIICEALFAAAQAPSHSSGLLALGIVVPDSRISA